MAKEWELRKRERYKNTSKELTTVQRVEALLKHGPLSTTQIYERLGIERGYVTMLLTRHSEKFVRLSQGIGIRPSVYDLASNQSPIEKKTNNGEG